MNAKILITLSQNGIISILFSNIFYLSSIPFLVHHPLSCCRLHMNPASGRSLLPDQAQSKA